MFATILEWHGPATDMNSVTVRTSLLLDRAQGGTVNKV